MGRTKQPERVVWVSEQDTYREVLDDSKPKVKLGRKVKCVVKSGKSRFVYEGD